MLRIGLDLKGTFSLSHSHSHSTFSGQFHPRGKGAHAMSLNLPYVKHQPLRQGQTTTPGITCPTLLDKCAGSLTFPANHVTLKMQDTGLPIYSPYLR